MIARPIKYDSQIASLNDGFPRTVAFLSTYDGRFAQENGREFALIIPARHFLEAENKL